MSYKIITSGTKTKIGILGGSFNPPHHGHIYISLEAIKKLQLSYVIWFITPCNPKKNPTDYLSLSARQEHCELITKVYQNHIKVTSLEKDWNTRYSYDTINKIKKLCLNNDLYWLIGMDNLYSIKTWYRWHDILSMIKVVAFKRNNLHIPQFLYPQVIFINNKNINISATEIRNNLNTIELLHK